MLQSFLQSVMAVPPVLLTKQLLPFSVGHWTLLSAVESPLMKAGEVRLNDILVFLAITTRSFEDGRKWLNALNEQTFVSEAKELGERCGLVDLEDTAQRIDKYLTLYCSCPRFRHSPDNQHSNLPEPLILVSALMNLGFSEDMAWNCPYGKAVWYAVAVNDRADAILNEQEIYALDHWDEIMDAVRSGGNGRN